MYLAEDRPWRRIGGIFWRPNDAGEGKILIFLQYIYFILFVNSLVNLRKYLPFKAVVHSFEGQEVLERSVLASCQKLLPSYMQRLDLLGLSLRFSSASAVYPRPQMLVQMERLPRNVNGKIDRSKHLGTLEHHTCQLSLSYTKARYMMYMAMGQKKNYISCS